MSFLFLKFTCTSFVACGEFYCYKESYCNVDN